MDELVASAVSHWAPRFTTNGVAVADFERVTSGLKDWDGWCSAWSQVGAEYEALGAEAVEEGRLRSAGQHYVQAAVCHHFGKFLFVQDPVRMREAHLAAVRCLDAALPHLDPPGRRVEIPFDGSRLVGVLRLPRGPGPHPVTVMIPGLDSAKEEFRSTEALFLERGVGTFSVDGPGQGEAEYDLAIRGDWEVPGGAILDAVSAEPDVDPDRLAVWGVSLGGYYAPRVASGDGRVRACVALAGPYDFGECWERLPALTRAAFRARSRAESDGHAREIAHTLSLTGRTASITCPLLVVTGRRDRLIPWQHAVRLAEEAKGETRLLLLDEGNHGCMNVAARHRQKTADWVATQLGAGE
ncbi:2,6-dihydroxypseudooxynicotine hydrolase [Streptosporangium lutulentum]|uniref:2,6-dihydroxypseudooxynicotine hydrolase n=1 Tax=Streptosporangium lutulentum TaxID=1461250 RepID=A0ABT9Q6S3_9ACTN|nr:alpha/beta hydrolase [Streptosporangium lutulentum]MDP9842446.1 2,6-dihydroxypseudooxynicotine hydrolase [Streptosporangium lutulentum]